MRDTRGMTSCFLFALTAFFVAGCHSQPNVSGVEKADAVGEALIRQRAEDWANAGAGQLR
jgi:hypothetical protein